MRSIEKYLRKEVKSTPFCPGCGHGILLGLVARTIESIDIDWNNIVFVSGIGCAAWIPSPNFKADTIHTLHGRAIAFATGIKAANNKLKVIVISGDGDLLSIGGNHLIHGARRNLDITVIMVNNFIYGMTGGQVAPTSPFNTITSTTLHGNKYHPFNVCDLMKASKAKYVARGSVSTPIQLLKYLKNALTGSGFRFIEVISPCPTQFGRKQGMDTPSALYNMINLKFKSKSKEEYELGEFCNEK